MSDPTHPFNRPEFTHKKAPVKKRRIIVIAGVVLLLVVAGGLTYAFRDKLFGGAAVQNTPETAEVTLSKATTAANAHLSNGDTAAAATVYDTAIKDSTSDDQQSALYLNKGLIFGTSDTPAAIKAVEQSVALKPTFENTSYLALLYERNGDKQKAIDAYEETIVLYNKLDSTEEEGGPTHVSTYEANIARLKASL